MNFIPAENELGDPQIKLRLDELGIEYEVLNSGTYMTLVEAGDGQKKQAVFIRSRRHEIGALKMREIFAPVFMSPDPFEAEFANSLLTINSVLKVGCCAVGVDDDGEHTLAVSLKINAFLSAEELNDAIEIAAATATQVKKMYMASVSIERN